METKTKTKSTKITKRTKIKKARDAKEYDMMLLINIRNNKCLERNYQELEYFGK